MSALGSVGLQNSATALLASQTDQTAGPIDLTPFCGNLNIDEKLKLSHENFKQLMEEFYKDITPLGQLTTTSGFPTPYMLAHFASKAYEDFKTGKTDAQYETRLALPDGWKLLTTASNNSKTNGYFGAAYWHPEHQQVVIAHRGTDPTSLGDLWTDAVGVFLKQHVPKIGSASTFAHKVVEVLREVNQKNGVSFQLFFTGHSLGGWLAQITTFTTKYLKTEGHIFLKSDNVPQSFHPHTVVFESPGCKGMLSEMRGTFDVRLDGRSIDLEHLDITSYLSAPNRINSCNAHLGTVYRIFTDLSDMDWHTSLRGTVYRFFSFLTNTVWQIKRSALYTSATHSMEKILQVFDPETGQVHKNEQGKLKVQVVTDWPISTGLRGGEEYKKFFEWAEQLNNYHPDIADESFRYLHYCRIRYQTKSYVEGVNSISVFSQEEQEFLHCYLGLRECPKSFKSKELFSLIKDSQVQGEAEKILQSFDIENGTIICTDDNALQALVPYVKRMLQLFPEIKEIGNRFYQCETNSCIEQINQSPLEFNPDALSVREFLEDEQKQVLQLRMVDSDEWAGLIKVYQVLQKSNFLTEGRYTALTLERFLSLNMLMAFRTLMQSVKEPYRILVACKSSQLLKGETKDMIRKLFETMKKKSCIKIILTTRAEDRGADILHQIGRELFGNGFVTRDEKLNWCDLTSSSQEKLLQKSVKFQSTKISLDELMSAESPQATFLPLGALLEGKELKIADPVPIPDAYNESCYIGRNFCRQKAIKQEIYSDKDVEDNSVFLVSTEQEFQQLCQMNPNSIVHWVERDRSGNFLWQQSQGRLETVRRYIDTQSSHIHTADDLDKLLEQAQHQRVMLISDTAGMGKSTVLTHLSKQIKQNFPAKWVVRIDLNDHTDALNALKQEQIGKEKAIEFMSEKLLKLKPGLELELFKQCCEKKQKVRIVIMLDGFDEISPFYKETVIDLVQGLRLTAVEQLWVTTRPHLREELEDKLQQLSYTLEHFSENNQVEFLTKFWSLKDWFTEPNDNEEEKEKNKLEIYAEKLIKKLSKSISDKDRQFTGIPLQTRMLAEAFDEEVRIFYRSNKFKPEISYKLDLYGLYKRFIQRKYDIFQEEKLQVSVNKAAAIDQRERDLKSVRFDHQLLALKVLFNEKQVALFQNSKESSLSAEQSTRIGIVQINCEGKPHFIHRTFAEYYVADCLVNSLTEGKNTSEQVVCFILKDIFLENDYRGIRVFLDGLLSRNKISKEVLKQYGIQIQNTRKFGDLILHNAALEGNSNIIEFLLDSVQAGSHRDTIKEVLLAKYREGFTAWHISVVSNNTQVLEKLWEWAGNKLTTEDINNTLLLGTDREGKTAWHLAANESNLEILQKVWKWAEENLTTEDIKHNFLLRTDSEGRTEWHLAAKERKVEILQKLWEWAEKKLTTEEINNKLLLRTDSKGMTAWQMAAWKGNLEILQKVWEWAEEKLITEEINNKWLLGTDNMGTTAWHYAAEDGNLEILQNIWEWAEEKLKTEDIKYKFLLGTDNMGRTTWQMAAWKGNVEIFKKVSDWAEEKLNTEEINRKLLLGTD